MADPSRDDASAPPSSVAEDRAYALLADFLRDRDAASELDFEALCARHPECEGELRSIRDAYLTLEDLLPGPVEAGPAPRGAPATPPEVTRLWQHLLHSGPRGDRYEERGELARGGMGVVLRVWDRELRRELAMKVLRDARSDDAGKTRFLAEAQVTSQLDHPGIVPVHEIGMRSGSSVYYTMRLVRGRELASVLPLGSATADGWDLPRVLDALLKVCDTMRYAHDQGVVHRDLKPSNIMVGAYGDVYVMDWGLARVLDTGSPASAKALQTERTALRTAVSDVPLTTLQGDVLGTPSYMSPEQASGRLELVDPRTDVYALGAVLYHVLTGHAPYAPPGASVDSETVLRQLRAGPPPPVRADTPACAPELAAICDRAMAREPAARYPDVAALERDLRAFVAGRVVRAYESGPVAELRKWIARNRTLTAVGVLALLATLVGLVVGTLFVRSTLAQREQRAIDRMIESLAEFDRQSSDRPPAGIDGSVADWWLGRARSLVDGGPDAGPGLAEYERQLEAFARRSTGSDPAGEPLVDGSPLSEVLGWKRAELLWRHRVLGTAPWLDADEVAARLAAIVLPDSATDCGKLAWSMIRPDRPGRYGDEQCAAMIARIAVWRASEEGELERARCSDTLAFALCRLGRFEEAALWQHAAIRSAIDRLLSSVKTAGYIEAEEWFHSITSNRRLQQRLALEARVEGARVCAALADEIHDLEWLLAARCRGFADTATALRYGQLVDIVAALRRLRSRIELAERATRLPESAAAWQRAIAAIAGDPRYGGRRIRPQPDLLPLGPDPGSGLQEFAHLPTGLPPARDRDGRLQLTGNTGIVFVLVPEQEREPPFLLAKHELTRAQWDRLAGICAIPSIATTSVFAVDWVSWVECNARLRSDCSWLRLPTRAEWLRAFAAGRADSWLQQSSDEELLSTDTFDTLPYRDNGGPVDQRSANPWGFHELLGNLLEFVADAASTESDQVRQRSVMGARRTQGIQDARNPDPLVRDERRQDSEVGCRPARDLFP
ncbi:MAG: protein kinase [Planctomycetes bacterium]|nr:protein kinase [Planctomycetota bacterium]